jgi:hypothetical protein
MHVRKAPPDIERIRSGLPEGLSTFIKGALVKRPDERLTDWPKIIAMLQSSGSVPDLREQEYKTELVTITYPPQADGAVRRGVERLMSDLGAVPHVELGHARVVPVAGTASSPLHPSRPADTAPLQVAGRAAAPATDNGGKVGLKDQTEAESTAGDGTPARPTPGLDN